MCLARVFLAGYMKMDGGWTLQFFGSLLCAIFSCQFPGSSILLYFWCVCYSLEYELWSKIIINTSADKWSPFGGALYFEILKSIFEVPNKAKNSSGHI